VSTDDQIVLLHPNYTNTEQQEKVIEQIATKPLDQRLENCFIGKTKHVVLISPHSSESHVLNTSYLEGVLDKQLGLHHKVILTSDPEAEKVYVYSSKQGKNLIEITTYPNKLQRNAGIKKFSWLYLNLLNSENAKYGKKEQNKRY